VPEAGAAGIDYVLAGSPPLSPPASSRTWLEPTFVIDYDDAHVVALRDEYLRGQHGPPTAASVVKFVAQKMHPSLDQGWALASRVATLLRGDCSEHAVLTAALARSVGLPARVAVGVVVIEDAGQYGAFGHAWAAIRDGERWQLADAALIGQGAAARYLALAWLEDEGPGFRMELIDPMSNWVQRVVVLGSAASTVQEHQR
jgi:hypothetical protein